MRHNFEVLVYLIHTTFQMETNSTSEPALIEAESLSPKRIRPLISDDRLAPSTREANLAEKERQQRISERQKKLSRNRHSATVLESGNCSTDDTNLVEVNASFVAQLKPHQIEGIKFMYNCTIESIAQMEKDGDSGGSGCILAHSMGLGNNFIE